MIRATTVEIKLKLSLRRTSPQCGNCVNVSVLRLNRGLLNAIIFLISLCSCATRKILNEFTSVTNAAPPLSKPEDYHRVNTFFTSLDKILAEIENRFSGNDQDVLCALGDIIVS